jgi:hypothetical protein
MDSSPWLAQGAVTILRILCDLILTSVDLAESEMLKSGDPPGAAPL